MLFQIAPSGLKIGEGRFRFHKSKLHQAACRIVDVDQCGTGGRTVLEPVMVAAINLDQFTAAGPAITWLLNFWNSLFAGDPETGFNHERSDSFFGQMDIVQFCEFFTCQRRPEVGLGADGCWVFRDDG